MRHMENLLVVALGVGTFVGGMILGCGDGASTASSNGSGASSVGGDGSGGIQGGSSSSSGGNAGGTGGMAASSSSGSAGSAGNGGSGGTGGCSTGADCSDGFNCTIDSCNAGTCEHAVGPNSGSTACPAGKICQLDNGCVDIIICADDATCIDRLGSDPCKDKIRCDPATSVCVSSPLDKDNDGHPPIVCGGADCDDSTNQTYPGAPEKCDNKDNNCNGMVDETATCPGLAMCQEGACVCPPQNACGTACVDTNTDNMHCGQCFNVCPGVSNCMNGVCICPGGSTTCGNVCVDTQTDAQNCGGCAKTCAPGYSCVGGFCTCLGTPCGMQCINTMNDPFNCGGCNMVCPATATCQNGMCACPMGQTSCNAQCVDTMTNTSHCGGCNVGCAAGASCQNGSCICPTGQTVCNGQCVNTMTNTSHCGGCNVACATGASCQGGSCVCPGGQTACNGQCVDTMTNTNHCGGCNMPCGGVCQNGSCVTCQVANLYLFADTSGSMADPDGTGSTKLVAMRTGINNFISNAGSANMGVGIGYHPTMSATGLCTLTMTACNTNADCTMIFETCDRTPSCVQADYQVPSVGIALLPGNQTAITSSLAARTATGGSMPPPGYRGALQYAKNYAIANSTQKAAVVLLTDGLPNVCNTNNDVPDDLLPIAQQFASGTPRIITFVVGIGDGIAPHPTQAQLNQVASAGGTGTAWLTNSAAGVTSALNSIRTLYKTCP